MNNPGFTSAKLTQRRVGRAARAEISPQCREQWDREICESIISCGALSGTKTVMSYVSHGGEVDLSFLHQYLLKSDVKLCFPVCTENGEMLAVCPEDDNAWEVGRYGIPSPILSKSETVLPEELDAVLVPCVAFDDSGNRLGQGGGYYDRFLPRCTNAITLAVAYEVQRTDRVESEKHDIKPSAIITEKQWYGDKFQEMELEK